MRARYWLLAALLLIIWLALRFTQAESATSAQTATPETASSAPAVASGPSPTTSVPEPSNGMSATLSRDQVEALVRADLARFLAVPIDGIRTAEVADRVWYNDSLGCHIRRGVPVDPPIPGFLIRLEHATQTFNYHTDQQGHFIRCPEQTRPSDRTTR